MQHDTEKTTYLENVYQEIPSNMQHYDVVNLLIYGWLDQSLIDYKPILSVQEKRLASKISVDCIRDNFILRRTLLKKLLGSIMLISAEEIPLKIDASSKPLVIGGPFFSHSNKLNCLLYSFSFPSDHGIDIEPLKENIETNQIISFCFSQKERENMLLASTKEEKLESFLKIWTQKEAILKYFGKHWECTIGFNRGHCYSFKIDLFLFSIALKNQLSRMKTFICRI